MNMPIDWKLMQLTYFVGVLGLFSYELLLLSF